MTTVLEILIFAVGIYIALRFLATIRGSGVVRGLGIVLFVAILLVAALIQAFELKRAALVFDELRDVSVIALVVVFHPEIRRALVQLGDRSRFGRFFRREVRTVHRLLLAVKRMKRDRIGALLVIEREASLDDYAQSGIRLDAEVNSYLIESLFSPNAVLHDGAVLLRGDRLIAASCVLPISSNAGISRRLGTRHRAAIGITEETDALAIVVSEETGNVSTALGGQLEQDLDMAGLEAAIGRALGIEKERRRK